MSRRRTGPLRFEPVGVTGETSAEDTPPADATDTLTGASVTTRAAPDDDAFVAGLGRASRLIVLIVMVALIELLPVQAWLMTLAAYQTGDARLTAMPFWLLALTLALFALGGRLTARSSMGIRVGAATVVGVVTFAAALLWPTGAFVISDPSNRALAFLGLLGLVAYLGWRGMGAGSAIPFAVAFERFRRIFAYGTAAMIGAITISIAAPDSARAPLIGALGLFLPIEVFAGLLALAISKAAYHRANAAGAETATPDESRWLGMALGLAALVVVVAFVVSLVVSFQTVSIALVQLGPLGALVNDAITWIVNGIVFLLYLIFNVPITLLKNRNLPFTRPRIPTACVQRIPGVNQRLKPGQIYCTPAHTPTLAANVITLIEAIVVGVIVVVVLFILFLIIRDLMRRGKRLLRRPRADADEEREDLDARNLLGAQLRGLLSVRRARRPAEEALPQGSVRWLYREALRAAAARGITRAPSETPDEFAARLAPVVGALAPAGRRGRAGGSAGASDGESRADFAELSDAYNRARYADDEPADPARGVLRDHATRLIRRLRGDGRRR